MVTIFKASTNKIYVTLSELAFNPCAGNYLFEFTNMSTLEKFYCNALSIVRRTRYNLFCIKETEDPNPQCGEVFFPLLGQHDYAIYENPCKTLDPTGLNLCESGKCQVITNPQCTPSFHSDTYPQYQFFGN
jgi:hypothetical protein